MSSSEDQRIHNLGGATTFFVVPYLPGTTLVLGQYEDENATNGVPAPPDQTGVYKATYAPEY